MESGLPATWCLGSRKESALAARGVPGRRYAMDYIFYASVPGQAPSFTEDFLLGLLISLGNAIVGNAVEIVVGWCGIRDQGALACRGTFKLVGD